MVRAFWRWLMAALALVAIFGTWVLVPVAIGAWIYRRSAAGSRLNAGLRLFALLGIPIAIGAIWLSVDGAEASPRHSPAAAPAFFAALTVGSAAVGVACAYLIAKLSWLGWIAAALVLSFVLLAAALLTVSMGLWMGGFH
jgi:hypothetical protein